MITRLLATTALFILALTSLAAQFTIQPLGGYDTPGSDAQGTPVEKVDCQPIDETAFTLLRPGASLERLIQPDTFNLEGPITYACQGCNVAAGGQALLRRDTLIYTANADVEEVADTLIVQGCGSDGECGEETVIVIVVQREGRTVNLPTQTAQPGQKINVSGPADDFARKAFCRSIENCAPDYLGRDQRFFFINSQAESNDFAYTAARYGGTDAVCIQLCTAFGLCDTYRTEININRPSLGLPFVDDFSEDNFRPDASLWQDRDVLINRTFAQQPPSVGVATFDAVASDGAAYAISGSNRPAVRDYLTSAPLKMNGQDGAALSFFLQPRGLGNRPERQDSFVVQFLHPEGDFRTVLGVGGRSTTEPSTVPLPFEPYLIMLDADYLYDGFTFRFANKSSERGAVDMWHLDYVKLAREDNDITTDDLALTQVPGSVLGPLTSLPLRHFQAADDNLVAPGIEVGVFNVSDGAIELSSGKESEITVLTPDFNVVALGNLQNADVTNLPNSFPSLTTVDRPLNENWTGLSAVENYLNGLPLTEEPVILDTRFTLSPAGGAESSSPGFLKTRENNELSTLTILDEYMAYDDGSAEATIELTEGTVTLQRYVAYVEDELRGIQVRIPRGLASFGNQQLRLVVYSGDAEPDELIYSEDFDIVVPEDILRDSLEGFTTYIFDTPFPLTEGVFFVGWEQQRSTVPVGIGYDRNTAPAAGTQWFNFGSGWRQLAGSVSGALMLRPLLGGFEGFTTSTPDTELATSLIEVFPNPTDGELRIRPTGDLQLNNLQLQLFSATGALLQSATGVDRLDLRSYPAGLYLLEVTDGARRSQHKIIRQ
ncbi:T9SS type A sorting domain-containing protein [Lewinella sp. 4G2]|uniref:T9SS type A sorting domain-containing protein n=1 Tax=Lewinella sp. 4G2 TaxID=1803372 RepID=UPI0007E1F893|nr:T9SS type A sorting domain-containing protein [Lewinella sp. 4G2]OAV43360.1 hypothetical protein A3850_002100 [Lewinella sp. 4G2]